MCARVLFLFFFFTCVCVFPIMVYVCICLKVYMYECLYVGAFAFVVSIFMMLLSFFHCYLSFCTFMYDLFCAPYTIAEYDGDDWHIVAHLSVAAPAALDMRLAFDDLKPALLRGDAHGICG